MSRDHFEHIHGTIAHKLHSRSNVNGGVAMCSRCRFGLALRTFAGGKYQDLEQVYGTSQPTISRNMKRVIEALLEVHGAQLNFPLNDQPELVKMEAQFSR